MNNLSHTNPIRAMFGKRRLSHKHFQGMLVLDTHGIPTYEEFKNGNIYIMGRNTVYAYLKSYGYKWNNEVWSK